MKKITILLLLTIGFCAYGLKYDDYQVGERPYYFLRSDGDLEVLLVDYIKMVGINQSITYATIQKFLEVTPNADPALMSIASNFLNQCFRIPDVNPRGIIKNINKVYFKMSFDELFNIGLFFLKIDRMHKEAYGEDSGLYFLNIFTEDLKFIDVIEKKENATEEEKKVSEFLKGIYEKKGTSPSDLIVYLNRKNNILYYFN